MAAWMLYPLPDKQMLQLEYRIKNGRRLNLTNPVRFTEKIQWYKCYYRNPLMLQCTDKYQVREYVNRKLGTSQYLNNLYLLVDRAEDIDFDSLPEQFVIKTTDGSSGDNVLIVKNKQELDIPQAIKKVNKWRNRRNYVISREWAYRGAGKSQIVVEQYLKDSSNADEALNDYKFLCFNGKFQYMWVDKDRYTNHTRCFYDRDFKWIPGIDFEYPASATEFPLPDNVKDMVPIAEKLSEDFPFARIDLYNIQGRIVFGEITFYPGSGFHNTTPDSFDFELGRHWKMCNNTTTSPTP